MHRCNPWFAALLLAALAGRAPAANVAGFLDFSLKSGAATILPGRLYVPPEASLPGWRKCDAKDQGSRRAYRDNSSLKHRAGRIKH